MMKEAIAILDFDLDGRRLSHKLRRDLFCFLGRPSPLFYISSKEGFAVGASEYRYFLKPSKRFLKFLFALRACDRNRRASA
jgi:hypothetical protein